MGFFNTLFKRKNDIETFLEQEDKIEIEQEPKEATYIPVDLPEGELVAFNEQVLDTNSRASIEKFKHNLEILMKEAKEKGKIDKFMLIREDNFFPNDWEWTKLSKDTNLEKICTTLSFELRKAYALEQEGIEPFTEVMGIRVPNASRDNI